MQLNSIFISALTVSDGWQACKNFLLGILPNLELLWLCGACLAFSTLLNALSTKQQPSTEYLD